MVKNNNKHYTIMKFKTLIVGLALTANPITMAAQENVLQVVPTTYTADGKTKILNIEMNNSETINAMQFKIVFPEGITLANRAKPYGSLPKNRYPYTEVYDELEETTTTTFEHSVALGSKDNVTTIVISPNTLSDIKGNSGVVLKLYIDLATDIEPGIYPIMFNEIVLSKSEGNTAIRVAEAASYIIVGNPEFSGTFNLSSLTGYMPADVVNATNELLSTETDVTGIDLTGIDETGATVSSTANANLLVYAKSGAAFAAAQSAATNNVVVGATCDELVITDGYPFAASKAFTAANASYSRTVPAAGWYSLCLPFAAETPEGVIVERYVSKDVTNKTVTFNSGAIDADTPCIFNTTSTNVTFSGSNVAVAVTGSELADGDFIGTYTKKSGTLNGFYGLKPDGSGFGIATSTAYVDPFRAYINTSDTPVAALRIIHGGKDDGATGITTVDAKTINGSKVYFNLAGQRVTRPMKGIYIVDGKTVMIQ